MTKEEFLCKLGPMAQADMAKTGIPASLTLAQGILESNWGSSGLTVHANNLFGIKGTFEGQTYLCKTFEVLEGKRVEIEARFRKYPSWQASVDDHSALFLRLPRYANLRGCKDYREACRNVMADGYATAPDYDQVLIRLIEQYQLTKYERWRVEVRTFSNRADAERLHEALDHMDGLYNYVESLASGGFAVIVESFSDGMRAEEVAEGIRKLTGFYCRVLPVPIR